MGDGCRLVTLKSGTHHDLLVRGLWNFFQKEHGVDFNFELRGGRPLRAHSLILEVFLPSENVESLGDARSVGTGGGEESVADPADDRKSGQLDLNYVVLEFLYKGSVAVPQEHLDNLLQLATKLKFKLLVEVIKHSKSRVRHLKGAKRACQVDLVSYDHGKEMQGQNETVIRKPTKSRKPRKSIPRKARGVVASCSVDQPITSLVQLEPELHETDSTTTTRQMMPRRLAKEHTMERTTEADASDNEPPSSSSGSLLSRLFGCPQCPYMTRTRNRLEIHVARHDVTATFFPCPECHKSFLRAASLERHRLHVHSSDPSKKPCPHCDAEVSSRSGLIGHIRVVHGLNSSGKPVKKKLVCDFCRETFVYKSHLDLHVATKHTGDRPFRCSECSYSAFRFMELRTHVKFKHATERPCVCEVCGFTTVTMSNMIKHRRVHTKEKPFVCQCGKAYRNKESLNQHAVRHEEGYSDEKARTHMCHVCGKGFLSRKNLMGHLRKIHLINTPPSTTSKTRDPPAPPDNHFPLDDHSKNSAPDW